MREVSKLAPFFESLKRSVQISTLSQRELSRRNLQIGSLARAGNIAAARMLFDRMPNRDVVSWNAMITAHWQNNNLPESKKLFRSMPERNIVSWNTMIAGCLNNCLVDEAFSYFLEMPKRNVASWNVMISGFVKFDRMNEAEKLFDEMPERNVISYTAMLDGLARNGMIDCARKLFDTMEGRNLLNLVSWAAMISGYVENGRFEEARYLFHQMPEKNLVVITAMITGYCKEGKVEAARSLFDGISHKDIVSWNAMIAGYSHNGYGEEALKLHILMMEVGMRADHATIIALFTACSALSLLQRGRQSHAISIKTRLDSDISLCNALMTMYSRCGSIGDSEFVFQTMQNRDVVSWNTIIAAFAQHGLYQKVMALFLDMEADKFIPNGVTFLSILSACGHSGKANESLKWFNLMVSRYEITPMPEHYGCLVDILCKAGMWDEACKHVKDMPFEAKRTIWGSLLGACQMYRNLELGEVAAEKLFQLDPKCSGAYVMLSNIYAAVGMWKQVSRVREKMNRCGVKKQPGYSWTEISDKVHIFLVGDSSHPDIGRIQFELKCIGLHMRNSTAEVAVSDCIYQYS
ncbi:pentatricopeptide repeat-containing protein At4g02750-like [Dendrobium catenatum]|uniref:Pentatricopeptide repeat-containing protein n=1 Tax=Dendrobium catenatum TaxID=906689 RepID=A0A2I0W634_9ASPA|nr:pentatricopeptide repeat-containing protein At4g02750-like [Dendrobium catenatum]PKU71119.1 Pentatricopeptide repeat-containing protein [Dendrobium catenatum]